MAGKTVIKPYKLKPSGETMSRDDLSTWKQVMLGHCRQNDKWIQFLPTSTTHHTWKSSDDDETNGLEGADATETNALRASFQDYLTCVATYSPAGFNDTIMREATSFNWILDTIKRTFGLETKGENFLALEDLKFDWDIVTYQQGLMEVKDFVCAGLKKKGDEIDGKILANNEPLTPALKNFIFKEFLTKVDKRMPKHVKETRGHLFTAARPSLACNQHILCEQIPAMLAELEKADNTHHGSVSIGHVPSTQQDGANMGYVPAQRGGQRGGRFMQGRNYLSRVPFRGGPVRVPPPRRDQGCFRCLEATPPRYDAARTHQVRDCTWPPQQRSSTSSTRQPNFKVVVFPENNQTQYPQQATLSMGQLGLTDQPTYSQGGDQYYTHDYYYDQFYQSQEDYPGASISEDL